MAQNDGRVVRSKEPPEKGQAPKYFRVPAYRAPEHQLVRANIAFWFLKAKSPAVNYSLRGTGFGPRRFGYLASRSCEVWSNSCPRRDRDRWWPPAGLDRVARSAETTRGEESALPTWSLVTSRGAGRHAPDSLTHRQTDPGVPPSNLFQPRSIQRRRYIPIAIN
jgi:hypothetical protein